MFVTPQKVRQSDTMDLFYNLQKFVDKLRKNTVFQPLRKDDSHFSLHIFKRYVILCIEKGKAREAAYPEQLSNCFINSRHYSQ